MSGNFAHKVALVTGATSGIGRATALALAARGARVVVAGRRQLQGELVVEEIRAHGGDGFFIRVDVSSSASVEAMVRETIRRYDRLDLAFNNAGISGAAFLRTAEQTEENWDAVLNTNLLGVWRCMRSEIPLMLQAEGGAIVNTSSDVGLAGSDLGVSPYVASKHAVVGLTRAAAIEYAREGLRINAICPAITYSEMIEPALAAGADRLHDYVRARVPMGRIANASEVASAVLWLLSDEASFVTGQAVAVDGGVLAK